MTPEPLLIEMHPKTPQEWLEMPQDEFLAAVLSKLNEVRGALEMPPIFTIPQGDLSSTGNPISAAISERLFAYPNRELGSAFCMSDNEPLCRALYAKKAATNARQFEMVQGGADWWDMVLFSPLSIFLGRLHHGAYPQLMLPEELAA